MAQTMHPTVVAVLADLPDEMAEAARAALASGGTWTHEPESAESGDARPYRNEDGQWCLEYVEQGYEVEAGRLYHVRWTCDSDGNWDSDRTDVTDPLYADWAEEVFGFETGEQEWRAYHEFVAETGTDPLGEFLIARVVREDTRWEIEFAEERTHDGQPIGVVVRRARKDGEGEWRVPADLPEPVRQYLTLPPGQTRLDNIWSLEALRAADTVTWTGIVESPTEATGWITVTITSPRPEADIVADIRAAARRALGVPAQMAAEEAEGLDLDGSEQEPDEAPGLTLAAQEASDVPPVDDEEWREAGQVPS